MKTIKNTIFAPLLTVILLLASCSEKISFPVSTVAPAAEARAKVKKDGNNNYAIELEVKNLSSPDRLNPSKKMYVVWLETADNGVKNIGQLVTSDSNYGQLITTTPFKPTQIIITAEDESNLSMPGSQVVLKSNTF